MSNKQYWNTVDWSQVPKDVDAVITYEDSCPNYYKLVYGNLMYQTNIVGEYNLSAYADFNELCLRSATDFTYAQNFLNQLRLRVLKCMSPSQSSKMHRS